MTILIINDTFKNYDVGDVCWRQFVLVTSLCYDSGTKILETVTIIKSPKSLAPELTGYFLEKFSWSQADDVTMSILNSASER